jgi:hypothetical protein
MQQNAQQGQVDQMAQQVAQRMQQQQQPPGVSGLPAGNMGFREGGIIPYANGGGVDLSGLYGRNMSPQAGIEGALAPTPAMEESPDIAAIRAELARVKALQNARPDYHAQQIAALDADKQARAKAAAAQQERQGFEGLMALLAGGAKGGLGGMGDANTQFNKELAGRQNAGREATLLDAQMRIKLGELEHARQIGDATNAMSAAKDIAGIKRQMEANAINRAQVAEAGRGHTMTSNTAAAQIASREKEGGLDRKSAQIIAGMRGGAEGGGGRLNLAEYKALAKPIEDELKALAPRVQGKIKSAVDRATELNAKLKVLKEIHGLPSTDASAPDAPAGASNWSPAQERKK